MLLFTELISCLVEDDSRSEGEFNVVASAEVSMDATEDATIDAFNLLLDIMLGEGEVGDIRPVPGHT